MRQLATLLDTVEYFHTLEYYINKVIKAFIVLL
jgi:hypothetical protein